jgi:predicted metal-dependent peptidase
MNKPPQPKRRSGGSGESEQDQRRQDGAASSQARQLGSRIHADLLVEGTQQAPSELEAEESQKWIARLSQCESGDGESSILRGLIHDLPHVRTPWELVLRTRLARALAPSPSLSWSRPSRSYIANQGRSASGLRMPYEPGRSQSKLVPRLAVIVDVSGSITEGVLRQFTREIAAISRRQEAPLTLIIGDDQVREVSVFEPGSVSFEDVQFRGGGGTDYTPLLAEADRHHPDIGVVLGDLDGPAHFRPHWPVIWAVPPQSAKAVPPFGSKLVLA